MPKGYNHLDFLMRPAGFHHIVFGGYTTLSSIFYFWKNLGYYYLTPIDNFMIDEKMIMQIVEGQRYYLLCHIFFIIGIMIKMDYNQKIKFKIHIKDNVRFLIITTFVFTGIYGVLKLNAGTAQIGIIFLNFSLVSSIIATAFSLRDKNVLNKIVAISFFSLNYYSAISSGWKEAIILPIILLMAYLYPFYKTSVKVLAPFIVAILFYVVPTYNNIIRSTSDFWISSEETESTVVSAEKAKELALKQIKFGDVDLAKDAWNFISGRITELDMFVVYIEHFPVYHDFYGLDIVKQSFEALIPRAFNPTKPSTEAIAMQRVYEAGVVSEMSFVSAKPSPVADAYMSGGWIGVALTGFILGFVFSELSMLCERLFGGYFWGSCVVYTGLFLGDFRGQCFEFLMVDVFYRFLFIIIIFRLGLMFKIIQKV
jgi:hypothetical protein